VTVELDLFEPFGPLRTS